MGTRLLAAVLISAAVGWWNPGGILSQAQPVYAPELHGLREQRNWGIYNNRADSHVHAREAWSQLTKTGRIVVAVIDTGVSRHVELDPSLSKFGWDFVARAKAVDDFHGHGTHVAGIIDAVSRGRALIVPIRYYSDASPGSLNVRNTAKAIRYAVDHGAKIINYSAGGPEFNEEEYLAFKYAETHNVLVVTAAGNEKANADLTTNYYYPGAYRLKNMIVVASHDINNELLRSSNWGRTKVDVAAPGENIFSSLPGNKYGYMSGTSQATPFVTAAAVMMLLENPKLKPRDIAAIICDTVDEKPALQDKVRCKGRLNAFRAVVSAKAFTNAK